MMSGLGSAGAAEASTIVPLLIARPQAPPGSRGASNRAISVMRLPPDSTCTGIDQGLGARNPSRD